MSNLKDKVLENVNLPKNQLNYNQPTRQENVAQNLSLKNAQPHKAKQILLLTIIKILNNHNCRTATIQRTENAQLTNVHTV